MGATLPPGLALTGDYKAGDILSLLKLSLLLHRELVSVALIASIRIDTLIKVGRGLRCDHTLIQSSSVMRRGVLPRVVLLAISS